MVSGGVGEWMLARRFGDEKASEIAGDLLEQYKPARASWEMFRMALSIRGFELAGLLLVTVTLQMLGTTLFSPWQLHLVRSLRSAHEGGAWDTFSFVMVLFLASLLVAFCAALRLGSQHCIARCGLVLAIGWLSFGVMALQPGLRRASVVAGACFAVWLFRSFGVKSALSSILATFVVVGIRWVLLSSVKLPELRACMVHMRSEGFQPAWFNFYSACAPLAAHEWSTLFVTGVFIFWLVTFLPADSAKSLVAA